MWVLFSSFWFFIFSCFTALPDYLLDLQHSCWSDFFTWIYIKWFVIFDSTVCHKSFNLLWSALVKAEGNDWGQTILEKMFKVIFLFSNKTHSNEYGLQLANQFICIWTGTLPTSVTIDKQYILCHHYTSYST